MAKRKGSKAGKAAAAADETSVAKVGTTADAGTNGKLADFAKGQAKKQADKDAAAKAKEPKAAKGPKLGKDGLPKLPPLPRGAGKPKAEKPCECGCPLMTRSRFAPGHDSRLKGWAMRIARGQMKLGDMTEKYEASQGEQDAVEAFIKKAKKEGTYEALKVPTAPVKKAKPVVEDVDGEDEAAEEAEAE